MLTYYISKTDLHSSTDYLHRLWMSRVSTSLSGFVLLYRCVRSYMECYKAVCEAVYAKSDVISRAVQMAGNR